MKSRDIARLLHVADLKYQHDRAKLLTLQQQENALRAKLRDLSDHEHASSHHLTHTGPYSSSGANLSWQSWVSKTRHQMNIELAQIMARKEMLLENLRKSFGQKDALQTIQRKEATARKRTAASKRYS